MNNEAHFHRRNLPHIYSPEASYFITYRLKGTIPLYTIKELKMKYEDKIRLNSIEESYRYQKIFFSEYDKLLNSAYYGRQRFYVKKIFQGFNFILY
jgi:hypothetical protein